MANRRIFCDKNEIVVMFFEGKNYKSLSLAASQVTRIQFDKCTERKFIFLSQPSEKIEIVTSKKGTPIVYTKMQEKQYFDQYKEELAKFAKDNRVTFYNNLDA